MNKEWLFNTIAFLSLISGVGGVLVSAIKLFTEPNLNWSLIFINSIIALVVSYAANDRALDIFFGTGDE